MDFPLKAIGRTVTEKDKQLFIFEGDALKALQGDESGKRSVCSVFFFCVCRVGLYEPVSTKYFCFFGSAMHLPYFS